MRALVDLGLFVPQEDAITRSNLDASPWTITSMNASRSIWPRWAPLRRIGSTGEFSLLAGMGSVEVGGRHVHPARAAVISS